MKNAAVPINDHVRARRWAVGLLRRIADGIERAEVTVLDDVLMRLPLADLDREAALLLQRRPIEHPPVNR